jgi:hypothetical protein
VNAGAVLRHQNCVTDRIFHVCRKVILSQTEHKQQLQVGLCTFKLFDVKRE